MFIKTNRNIITPDDIETKATILDVMFLTTPETRELLIVTDIGDILVNSENEKFEEIIALNPIKGFTFFRTENGLVTIDTTIFNALGKFVNSSSEIEVKTDD